MRTRTPVARRRQGERGYAVLMVFVLAASIAITLYMEVPRVAFESQRVREQLLIDRGEQYKRAIQIFYRKNKRFPTTMDELESYQNVRYLRHRYKDPMTGKEEWRVIHVGPNGMLTDSLVQKQQNPLGPNGTGNGQGPGSTGVGGIQNTGLTNPGFDPNQSQAGANAANGQAGAAGQQQPVNVNGVVDGTGGINMALARRPSDKTPSGTQGGPAPQPVDPNNPYQPQPPPLPQPSDPNNPNAQQYPPGSQPPPPTVAGYQPVQLQPGQTGPAGVAGQPGQTMQPGQPNMMGQPLPSGQSGTGITPVQFINPNQPYNPNNPTQPGQIGGFNSSGLNPAQNQNGQGAPPPNAAMQAIQQAIMSPRQPPPGVGSSFGVQQTGGIAGVATTYKGGSIKVINEKKKYQEWEFVYDMKKDKTIMGNAAAGMQQQQTTNPGLSNSNSSFGTNNSSFGGNSSFGAAGTANGTSNTGTTNTGTTPQTPPPQQ